MTLTGTQASFKYFILMHHYEQEKCLRDSDKDNIVMIINQGESILEKTCLVGWNRSFPPNITSKKCYYGKISALMKVMERMYHKRQ